VRAKDSGTSYVLVNLWLTLYKLTFELRETGDWDIFLGPPERARAETGNGRGRRQVELTDGC